MGEYFNSEEIIRDQILRRNSNPDLWLLLSEIQRASKNIIGYHQSRAEYLLLLGRDEEALNQLEFALKLTKNNFQISCFVNIRSFTSKSWYQPMPKSIWLRFI